MVAAGNQANAANISLPDGKRYFVSSRAGRRLHLGGAPIDPSAPSYTGTITVICNQLPLPTAQITVFAYHDNNPINNAAGRDRTRVARLQGAVEDAGGRYGMSGGHQSDGCLRQPLGNDLPAEPQRRL